METRKQYTAPQLTVVTFKAERGYALSTPLFDELLFWETEQSEQVEAYADHEVWNDGAGFWN